MKCEAIKCMHDLNQNVEILRAKAGRMASYGVTVDTTQVALVIIANIDLAAAEEWGSEFGKMLQTVHRWYLRVQLRAQ